MQKLRAHSKLLGLLSAHPLGHDLILLHPTAAVQSSTSAMSFQHLTLPGQSGIVTDNRKLSDKSAFDEFTNEDSSDRRTSTVEDLNILTVLLEEVVECKNDGSRGNVGDGKIRSLCGMYRYILPHHKHDFIRTLAKDYAVDHFNVIKAAAAVNEVDKTNLAKVVKSEEALRSSLTPVYSWLFKRIGRMENGVKFLVDFRTDILNCLTETEPNDTSAVALQQLNVCLRELLTLWFSVGFLQLERVTWKSSCEMLQKISEYEAVHPVRSWTDIKRRVGSYRRCFVFLHNSMPGEPLVVLHTALCDEIPASLAGIVSSRSRMSVDGTGHRSFPLLQSEDTTNVKSAIFYSITSTQRGLQGIDLGNYLIKKVVQELQVEFPQMTQFSTLSPIPNFKKWLLDRVKSAERGKNELLTQEEIELLSSKIEGDIWAGMRRILKNNSWVDSASLAAALTNPLLRACARYLYLEKRRGLALCSVGNFHLSNGAVLWRINWGADLSLRGLTHSCGIMVNYRYFLEETEENSQLYFGQQIVPASDDVRALATAAESLYLTSKM